jgi:hypothetical protein
MAVTWTKSKDTVFGDLRVRMGTITMDGVTSGAVDTGLERILGGSVVKQSFTSTIGEGTQIAFNSGSGATAINGMVQITTCTAGDDFQAVIFGT